MPITAQPPGPRRWLPRLRLALAWRRDPLACLLALARDYGDIVQIEVSGRSAILLNHPDFVAQALAGDDPAGPGSAAVADSVEKASGRALDSVWDLLAQHPDIERRVQEEVDSLAADGATAVLPYTGMVVAEALRLSPPVWAVWRRVTAPVGPGTAGHTMIGGYGIPAGMWLLISPWVLHHDPRYYPDPFRCDPLRWTPQAIAARPRYAYLPFGAPIAQPPWTADTVAAIAQHWPSFAAMAHYQASRHPDR